MKVRGTDYLACDWCELESGARYGGRVRKYADGSEMHPECHQYKLNFERMVRDLDEADIEKINALKAEVKSAERKYRSAVTKLAKKCGVPYGVLTDALAERAEQKKKAA